MATKKISLNELRSIVRQTIKEKTMLQLLNEGRLKLSPEDINFLNSLVPKYAKAVQTANTSELKKGIHISTYKYKMANGEDASVDFFIKHLDENWSGVFYRMDAQNLNDQVITINSKYLEPYFNTLIAKVITKMTGLSWSEMIRTTLYHEMIHAKDPARNNHFLKEPYDTSNREIYYASWAEFATMTGQFFEVIKNKVTELINALLADNSLNKKKYDEKIDEIRLVLQNILDYYSGKDKSLNNETKYFIQGTVGNNIQNFIRGIYQFLEQVSGSDFVGYELTGLTNYLSLIKKYNPEGWKEFNKDLYLTIQECVDTINDATPKAYYKIIELENPLINFANYLTQSDDSNVLAEPNDSKKIEKKYKKLIEPYYLNLLKTAPKINVGGLGNFKNMEKKAKYGYY